jgi:hypothetical protein
MEQQKPVVPSQDYHSSIRANVTAEEAFDKISRVGEWWTRSFKGKSKKIGDKFTVRFGDTFVDFKIDEVVPGKKVVWYVTNCNLHWIENKTEWKDTKVVWEVSSENGTTTVGMTHVGLTPNVECYNDCKVGWNGYIQKSLSSFMQNGKGLPDKF